MFHHKVDLDLRQQITSPVTVVMTLMLIKPSLQGTAEATWLYVRTLGLD